MINELDIQSQIVKSAEKTEGCFGFKLSNKFLAGIPDLLLTCDRVGAAFIEVKLLETERSLVLLTPLQIEKIHKLQSAGAWAGVAAICSLKNVPGNWSIFITTDPTKTRLDLDFIQLFKMRGEEWPVESMIRAVQFQIKLEGEKQ